MWFVVCNCYLPFAKPAVHFCKKVILFVMEKKHDNLSRWLFLTKQENVIHFTLSALSIRTCFDKEDLHKQCMYCTL
jgi:hypothetical protein